MYKILIVMKKMIPVIILLMLSASVFAQSVDVEPNRAGQGKQRLKAQRVAFITERIDLTPEEAEKFWPMYNQFEKDKLAIQKKYKRQARLTEMTDEQLEKHMEDTFTRDQEVLDLEKTYFQKFKKIIPIKKVAMFQVAEREFKRSIVNKFKGNRNQRRNWGQRNN